MPYNVPSFVLLRNMWWWILNAFCESISDVYWKRALEMRRVNQMLFMFLGNVGAMVGAILLFGLDKASFSTASVLMLFSLLGVVVFSFYISSINQALYTVEKISVLIPYQNIASILTIVFGFFIFADTSLSAFAVALVTMTVLMVFSIDYKSFRFPENFWKIVWVNFLSSCRSLAIVYLVKEISSASYFAITSIAAFLLLLIPVFWKRNYRELLGAGRKFYYNRMMASFIGGFGSFLVVFLLEDLGLILTTLLSFFGIGVSLLLSYLMLQDVPSKKDVILSIAASALVGLGFYLK